MRDARCVLARLERLANFLDAAIAIPGTSKRIGFDALIGLIPGIGDAISGLLAAYVVIEAIRLGAPAGLIARMIANVLIDTGLGSVPLAGDVFDALFQSNRRNVAMLREFLARQGTIVNPR
jgi:hypothetical protein